MKVDLGNRQSGSSDSKGFALVASLSVVMLLIMILLSLMSLVRIEIRHTGLHKHQDIAKANARLALMIAIGELQKLMGPDQRVTANAAILEDGDEGNETTHRNWLGVWKTTHSALDRDWPLIGKAPDQGECPYRYRGIYSDLRETEISLKGRQWRRELLQGWLVSKQSADWDLSQPLNEDIAVELVGRGTLGEGYKGKELRKHQVFVEKVPIRLRGSQGSYAWYVSDNNQKSSIALSARGEKDLSISFLAAQGDNPESVRDQNGMKPYGEYGAKSTGQYGKLITDRTVELITAKGFFHDMTTHGSGLFVDVTLGSLKKDLTPLLLGDINSADIHLGSLDQRVSEYGISSDSPIIPGPRHAILGPSFGALRHWSLSKYLKGLDAGEIQAQVLASNQSSARLRPNQDWPHGMSDGATYDGKNWASRAPKIHPVMTDIRWHYYLSHTEGTNNSLRLHLIPRVCLWNPYQVAMQCDELVVLMPNPLRQKNGFHMIFDELEVQRLKKKYPNPEDGLDIWGKVNDAGHHVGPFKIQPKGGVEAGKRTDLFPDSRYLSFVLDGTRFGPGECLVFSPRIDRPDHTSHGVRIQEYSKDSISRNRLSARVSPGEGHFFHDYKGDFKLQASWIEDGIDDRGKPIKKKKEGWKTIRADVFEEMQLGEIEYYEPWSVLYDNFPFVLKAVNGPLDKSAAEIVTGSALLFPTLQLNNHGNGGVSTYNYWYYAGSWGSSQGASNGTFGYLQSFEESPRKDAPALHQFGSKLLGLDESLVESNRPPLRCGRWAADHVVYHPATIAQWNVRPGLVTRSPVSSCAGDWYANSAGAWIQQFAPLSPMDTNDAPLRNEAGYYKKFPFGLSNQFLPMRDVVLFDLPSPKYGVLSLGALRHAQLSPYSWHPSYIVGSSHTDIHAPYYSSSRLSLEGAYKGLEQSSWDEAVGGSKPNRLEYGPRSHQINSSGLLQIGNDSANKVIERQNHSSKDEVLAYDIAFEVNQNLWDHYFFSGVPLSEGGFSFDWGQNEPNPLWNHRYQIDRSAMSKLGGAQTVEKDSEGLASGYWNHAYFIKNGGAFNVNSTSVPAWTSFLSGLQGIQRVTQNGEVGEEGDSVFSRVQHPHKAVSTENVNVVSSGGWGGGRVLKDFEIRLLAEEIVREVKLRGPFVSMADFVNRRLMAKPEKIKSDSPMMCGVIDAAIARSGLNKGIEKSSFLTQTNQAYDNNRDDGVECWKMDVDQQPKSKAWGIPGFLTQGDILEPLAPAMTVRGDSFTLRCYGESCDELGRICARAYLEAVVVRSADYVYDAPIRGPVSKGHHNKATESAMVLERATGAVKLGTLSKANQKFGRRFKLVSFRWLLPQEI